MADFRTAVARTSAVLQRGALSGLLLALTAFGGADGAPHDPAMLLDRLPPTWRDDRGEMLRLSEFHGRRVFVTMAFTSCHRICPLTMARLTELQRDLDTQGATAEFLIVSYDPRNDDPAAWRRYRVNHRLLRENWHFLTGTMGDTERLARLLGFEFWHYDEHVMHGYRIVELAGDGALRGTIDSAHSGWQVRL